MNKRIDEARSRMVDFILAASWDDDTVDAKITEMYLELDDQQRLELVAALAIFAWQQALDRWGDSLSASLYLAEFRKKLK